MDWTRGLGISYLRNAWILSFHDTVLIGLARPDCPTVFVSSAYPVLSGRRIVWIGLLLLLTHSEVLGTACHVHQSPFFAFHEVLVRHLLSSSSLRTALTLALTGSWSFRLRRNSATHSGISGSSPFTSASLEIVLKAFNPFRSSFF